VPPACDDFGLAYTYARLRVMRIGDGARRSPQQSDCQAGTELSFIIVQTLAVEAECGSSTARKCSSKGLKMDMFWPILDRVWRRYWHRVQENEAAVSKKHGQN
jgi:hypothetical protein